MLSRASSVLPARVLLPPGRARVCSPGSERAASAGSAVGRVFLVSGVLFALAFGQNWVETSRADFIDGEIDAQMYVSHRAQLESDTGCIEFYARFDVDNNGYYDLACSDDSGPHLTLYLGDVTGYSPDNRLDFDITSGGNVDLADLNLDGYAELIHSGWRASHVTIYWGTPGGPSPTDTTWLTYSGQGEDVNVYDLDKDGYLDIVVGSSDGNLYLFWGSAGGYSSANRTIVPLGYMVGHNTDIADFDKDGWGDIAVSMWTYDHVAIVYWGPNRQPRNTLWLPFRWNNAHGITLGDFNRDQWLDILFTGYDTVVTSYIYWGSAGGFDSSNCLPLHPGQCYGGSSAADLNGDGWLDIAFFRGNWINGGRWKPEIYYNSGVPPYFSDANRVTIGTDTLNASGGFIADLNFDGSIDIFVNNMVRYDSSFVLWGPNYTSRTALPVNNDHHGVFREPGSSFDRARAAQYFSSIYDAGQDSMIVGGSATWVAFEPPGSRAAVAYRAGDTPAPDSTWTSFVTVNVRGDPLPVEVRGHRYLQYRVRFAYNFPCYLPDMEEINTTLVRGRSGYYDVGVERIIAPGGTVDSGTVVVPVAVVGNYGSQTGVFPVYMLIGGAYSDSVNLSLIPGEVDTVAFAPWTAEPVGSVPVTCYTAFPPDEYPPNDTARTTVNVARLPLLDVGPVEILAPTDTLDSGTVVMPQAVVHNFGNQAATFPVHLRIGAAYAESVSVNLAPGASDTVSFVAWTAQPLGTLAVTCRTALVGDQRQANDTIYDTVVVVQPPRFDVGPTGILAPVDSVDSGEVVFPRVVVRNYGNRPASFPMHLRIGPLYAESVLVESLAVGAADTVLLTLWTASPSGTLAVECRTALVGDQNPANDTVRGQVTVLPPYVDVGPTLILAPIGVIDSGQAVTPQAVIRNFGNQGATFPVHMRIGAAYAESVLLTMVPRGIDTVSFPGWTASPVGVHFVVCNTSLRTDQNRSNDTIETQVTVAPPPFFDVGPTAVLTPRGIADSGNVVIPTVIVRNFGNRTAAFPVHLAIGSTYQDSAATVLAPGTDDTVSFTAWTASPVGPNAIVCRTALTNDQNPANDTLRSSVIVIPPPDFDVGVVTILDPTGNVDSGDVVVPRAVVHNYGNQTATFPVNMVIGTTYWDTVRLRLDPGADDVATFTPWNATTLGRYDVTAYTVLPGDQNPTNDTARGTVTVVVRPQYDVGPVEILAPADTVDSGMVIAPQAVIRNFGNQTVTFPVHLSIGGSYADVRSATMDPGTDDTVTFALWTAQPLGTTTLVCRTALSQDQNPANDTLRQPVTVVPKPNIDVGPTAILAPRGTVDSGTTVPPRAVVHNYADLGVTFPTYFRIGSAYLDSQTVTLAGGADDTLTFADWSALLKGTFQVSCFTRLDGDERPQNDTVHGSVTVIPPPVHDVGASRILAPVGTGLMEGDTVVPRALIRNYGTGIENFFNVRFRVTPGYDQRALVTQQLAPNSVVEVTFPAGVLQPGDLPLSCSTELSRDVVKTNDKVENQIHVAPSASLLIEYDLTDHIAVDARLVFPFYATLQAEEAARCTLVALNLPPGWNAWYVDSAGQQAIADLGTLAPGLQKQFGVFVEAPPSNLAGVLESLPTVAFIVRGQVAGRPNVNDTAALTLSLTPDLEIHNFPNPFGRNTKFVIGVPDPGVVSVTVYNRAGERICRVLDGVQLEAQVHIVPWDGTNDHGHKVAPGTYEYVYDFKATASSRGRRLTRKLVITGGGE